MKKNSFLFLIVIAFCFSCKKSDNTPKTNVSITGYWFGSATVGNEGQIFKSDGTTVEYDFYATNSTDTATCQNKGYGTYSVVGNKLNFTISYPTVGNESFNEVGTINTSVIPNTISGTYTGAGSGSFQFTKQ